MGISLGSVPLGIYQGCALIFFILFVTFLVLYIMRTDICSKIQYKKAQTQPNELVKPEPHPNDTNQKANANSKYEDPADVEASIQLAKSNYRLSRYRYGDTTRKPLLTIVTRTYGRDRNAMIRKNIAVCAEMLNNDFEHVILQSDQTMGMKVAEAALCAFCDQFQGEYVMHVDDDDFISNFHLVDILKQSAVSGVKMCIFKVWHAGVGCEFPKVWHQFPREGEITTSNFAMRADVYRNNIKTIARNHAGDYTLIHNALFDVQPKELVWIDDVAVCIRGSLKEPMDRVTVILKGGLGNQLFQIACADAYARTHHKQLIMDREIVKVGERSTYFQTMFGFVPNGNVDNVFWNEVTEDSFAFAELPKLYGNVRLNGYFQSEKYFIADLFLEKLKSPVGRWDSTVSLHIRRSDYVGNHFHTNQTMDYYLAAIQYMKDRVENMKIVIFSDDLMWCRAQSIWEGLSVTFGADALDGALSPEENDLRNMARCQHHIIANSSFSWWGAVLGRSKDSITIAPKTWFNDASVNWQDIYCSGWVVM